MDPFQIVKDSSLWQSNSTASAINKKDPYLRIAIVKKVYMEQPSTELRYLVEIQDRNDSIELNARMLRRFGGVFNYEDIVYHGYSFDDKPDPVHSFDAKAGDAVLVAFLNGEAREAVILGSLAHPAREATVDVTKGPQYVSEFNGIETTINDSGEYKITFKAVPTNVDKLNEKPNQRLPKPTYDAKVGGSFFKLDKTGSLELNDKNGSEVQNFRIDKPNGVVEINSGKIKLTFTKKDEKVDLKCKVINVVSDNKAFISTKELKVTATTSIKISSPKVAIGKDGIELLDQLFQLIDMLGKVTPISPIGPCTPLLSTPQWSGVAGVQTKIKDITGVL